MLVIYASLFKGHEINHFNKCIQAKSRQADIFTRKEQKDFKNTGRKNKKGTKKTKKDKMMTKRYKITRTEQDKKEREKIKRK